MTWDVGNRLKTIQVPGGSVVTNTYGFDGLRRRRDEGVAVVKYVWDGQRLLLESDGDDVTQVLYTSGLGAYGNVISQRRSNATAYLHPDHLGTIWALTDASQATSDAYLFDAWGRLLASSGSTVNPHRYVGALGYYTEPTLSLDYVRARWYRPSVGGWLSADPELDGGRYAYVTAQPLRVIDPTGLWTLPWTPGDAGTPFTSLPPHPPLYGPDGPTGVTTCLASGAQLVGPRRAQGTGVTNPCGEGAYGCTPCNFEVGFPYTIIIDESCMRRCTMRHEGAHMRDLAECCWRAYLCRQTQPGLVPSAVEGGDGDS
jgi:RHS repeat-associated protein